MSRDLEEVFMKKWSQVKKYLYKKNFLGSCDSNRMEKIVTDLSPGRLVTINTGVMCLLSRYPALNSE